MVEVNTAFSPAEDTTPEKVPAHFYKDGILYVRKHPRFPIPEDKIEQMATHLQPLIRDYNRWCATPTMTLQDIADKYDIGVTVASITFAASKLREDPKSLHVIGRLRAADNNRPMHTKAERKPAAAPIPVTAPVTAPPVASVVNLADMQPTIEELEARKRAQRAALRVALQPVLFAPRAAETTPPVQKWHECRSVAEYGAYLKSLGFLPLGNIQEIVLRKGVSTTIGSHQYAIHAQSGVIVSIDKLPTTRAQVAFYAVMGEANATPTCFFDFTDAVKMNLKHNGMNSRIVIARLYGALEQTPEPAAILRSIKRAHDTNTLLGFGGFPITPAGFDKYGHLTWLKHHVMTSLPTTDKTLAALQVKLPETMRLGDIENLIRDKKTPPLSHFITQYGIEPAGISADGSAGAAPRAVTLQSSRTKIDLEKIENEGMKAFASDWNNDVGVVHLANTHKLAPSSVYMTVARLRDDPTYVFRYLQPPREKKPRSLKERKPYVRPSTSGRKRTPITTDNITNETMLAFASAWNAGTSFADLETDYKLAEYTARRTAARLRTDPRYLIRNLRLKQNKRNPAVPKGYGGVRGLIPLEGIENEGMKAFASDWNDGVAKEDLAAIYKIAAATLPTAAARLRANPKFAFKSLQPKSEPKIRVPREKKSKPPREARMSGKPRKQISLEGVTNEDMQQFAAAWNSKAPLSEITAAYTLTAPAVKAVAMRLRENPQFVMKAFRPKKAVKQGPGRGGKARTPIATENIKHETMQKFAADWNSNVATSDIAATYGMKEGTVKVSASKLRRDSSYEIRGCKKPDPQEQPKQNQHPQSGARATYLIDVDKVVNPHMKVFAADWNNNVSYDDMAERHHTTAANILNIGKRLSKEPGFVTKYYVHLTAQKAPVAAPSSVAATQPPAPQPKPQREPLNMDKVPQNHRDFALAYNAWCANDKITIPQVAKRLNISTATFYIRLKALRNGIAKPPKALKAPKHAAPPKKERFLPESREELRTTIADLIKDAGGVEKFQIERKQRLDAARAKLGDFVVSTIDLSGIPSRVHVLQKPAIDMVEYLMAENFSVIAAPAKRKDAFQASLLAQFEDTRSNSVARQLAEVEACDASGNIWILNKPGISLFINDTERLDTEDAKAIVQFVTIETGSLRHPGLGTVTNFAIRAPAILGDRIMRNAFFKSCFSLAASADSINGFMSTYNVVALARPIACDADGLKHLKPGARKALCLPGSKVSGRILNMI